MVVLRYLAPLSYKKKMLSLEYWKNQEFLGWRHKSVPIKQKLLTFEEGWRKFTIITRKLYEFLIRSASVDIRIENSFFSSY